MGRYLVTCTIAADICGCLLSYFYGATFLPLLGDLILWLGAALRYILPFLHAAPPPLLHNLLFFLNHGNRSLGYFWIGLYFIVHLVYAFRHFYGRYHETDLAEPAPGTPGERKWETVQRRYRDYQEALQRFRPQIHLRTPPTFRYYKRKDEPEHELQLGNTIFKIPRIPTRGELEWRGRMPIFEASLLDPQRVLDLAAMLAHQLAYYNSDDLWFLGFLDYYPERIKLRYVLLGIGMWLPTLVKVCLWPIIYWRKRIKLADKFAFALGQGWPQYRQLQAQEELEEQKRQLRTAISRQLDILQKQWKTRRHPSSDSVAIYEHVAIHEQILQLQQLLRQLDKDVRRSFFSPYPLLSSRLGQLEALLTTESTWMEKHGIIPTDPATDLPQTQEDQHKLNQGIDQDHSRK